MGDKKNCWEVMKCGREPNGAKVEEHGVCPAAIDKKYNGINNGINAGRFCWKVSGTFCADIIKSQFAGDMISCQLCPFFKSVTKKGN